VPPEAVKVTLGPELLFKQAAVGAEIVAVIIALQILLLNKNIKININLDRGLIRYSEVMLVRLYIKKAFGLRLKLEL
jgi:hypothetical protein